MTEYTFDDELNIRLVRGIEKGYSSYAELRREKRNELLVSGAYAWVKGNHIEDQVARELLEVGVHYTEEKAGYTWAYLRFGDVEENNLFLIKNANIVRGKKRKPILDAPNTDYYLVEMSKINAHIDFEEVKGIKQGSLEFFDLPMPKSVEEEKIQELKDQYKRFYILTYTIDQESRMLSAVDLWMPAFQGGTKVEMVKVDSLTKHLGNTGAVINMDAISELVNIPEEEFSGTAAEFDYKAIPEKEREEA